MARIYKTLKELKTMKTEIEWLWRDLILRGHISVLGSRGGVGKSALALYIAHELAKEGLTTLYVDAERTGGTHGDRAKCWNFTNDEKIIFTCYDVSENLDESKVEPGPVKDATELLAAAMDINPDLIIIDSMTYDASHIKAKEREEVTNYLKGLKRVAAKMDCGLLLLVHANKKQDPAEVLTIDSLYGSGGLTDGARSVFIIEYVDQDNLPTQRNLKHVKSNYGKLSPDISFTLDDHGISNMSEFTGNVRKSGVRAEELRNMVKKYYYSGLSKAEIQQKLIEDKAGSPNERSRAVRAVTKELNIQWS